MTGLPLGLLVTLVPAAIAILFGGFSFVLIQGSFVRYSPESS